MDSALMAGDFPAADEMEYPYSYVFVIDVPGLESEDITIQVKENKLVISGERKRDDEKGGAKYLKMKRRVGKFMREFVLAENANKVAVSAVCQVGLLRVTVEKVPPPQVQVKVKVD